MDSANMTRHEFLKGALAALGFAALPGGIAFAAPRGWKPEKAPNLVFGVVSDTHIRTDWSGEKPSWRFPIKYFRSALEYFKAANVDAVVHCGDFAHRGMAASIQFHADAWREVFGKHGGPVKLFVSGNHDIIGGNYGNFASQLFKDETLRNEHLFCHDSAAKWEKIWGEPYEPLWHKEVKGYHFFGRQWETKDEMSMAQFVEERAKKYQLDGKKPFFCLQHCGPGRKLCARLNKRPNVVCFFGHAHNTAANWNNVLVREGCPLVSIPSCEPRGALTFWSDKYIAKAALAKHAAVGGGRQGYVVRVYDDMLTIERREFGDGGSLGPDWVLPLSWGTGNGERGTGKHPFSKDELKKVIGEPQFREGAKLEVELEKRVGVGEMDNSTLPLELKTPTVLRVKIPLADGNPDSRVYAYEVVVAGEGVKLRKAVYATGVNMGIGHEPNGGVTTLEIARNELPSGKTLTVSVRPLTSLGTSGRPIITDFKV
jgi:predicted phosphodiesterase